MLNNPARNPELKYYGIYQAKCLNNLDPMDMGRVLVHIYRRDGDLNYDEQSHQWVPVLSPYGGNSKMGFFMLPPIHADGFVIFEDGSPNRPVWIGTYAFPPKLEIDVEASNTAGYTVFKKEATTPQETQGDPTRIVLKTQYMPVEDPNISSDTNKVENLLIMDESKLELVHVNQDQYKFDAGGITSNTARAYVKLEDSTVTLGVRNKDGEVHEIQVSEKGITIRTNDGGLFSMSNGFIELLGTEKTKTKINIKSLVGAVEVFSKQVLVDGEQIIQGAVGQQGGGGVVTCDTICPFVGKAIHLGSTKTIMGG
jgi:hypothetical protein